MLESRLERCKEALHECELVLEDPEQHISTSPEAVTLKKVNLCP